MKKDNFYLCLNVLNILLCLSTYLTLLIFFIIFSIAENSFIPICKRTTSSGIFDSQFGNFGTDNFRNLN